LGLRDVGRSPPMVTPRRNTRRNCREGKRSDIRRGQNNRQALKRRARRRPGFSDMWVGKRVTRPPALTGGISLPEDARGPSLSISPERNAIGGDTRSKSHGHRDRALPRLWGGCQGRFWGDVGGGGGAGPVVGCLLWGVGGGWGGATGGFGA